MPFKSNTIIELADPNYVPVIKDAETYYGGSQMWFPTDHWYSKDYVLHNYGCGTIATADLFLYLALRRNHFKTPETAIALQGTTQILFDNYDMYVRLIHDQYTKTRRFLAVLGPSVAKSINAYSNLHNFDLKASWKWKLTYYDMLELIEEMLKRDIPIILSIGPNTPKLWGKKGISFYERCEIDYLEHTTQTGEMIKPYYYKVVKQDINGHYVTVTALIKDELTGQIMLRISSWGKKFYINYEEYRDYVENYSGTYTSSMVHVKKG